jgi:gliding motility-associated-like protein
MFQVASPGDLLIYIQQFSQYNNTTCSPDPNSTNLDIDFACWGPFPDVYDEDDFVTKLCNNTFTLSSSSLSSHRPSNGNHSNNNLGGYPVNSNPSNPNNVALTDCSYDGSATEWCFLPNAQQGDWYLLLICNYNSSGTPGYFSFTTLHTSASGSSNYTGSTNCDLLNCLSTNEEMPCEGSEITLYCTVPASDLPSNVQYRWIAPDSTILATTTESSYALTVGPTMSGRYTLVLVGTTPERRGFIDITVQQTPVSINASEEVICKGDSVVLSTPYNLYYTPQYYGYYRWYHNSLDSSVICTDTSLVVYPEEDCNYIVKVKNGSTECTNTSTVHITVNPIPEVTITAQDEHLCYGESTSINANCSDNVTYQWSNGNTNASINVHPTETQTYTVTAKLREGAQCEKSESITIHVDPQIHLTSEVIDAHCGQSVGKITMHATGGDGHFAFTSNPSTAIFIDSVASNVTAGSYLVTASDGMACTQSTTVDVADIPGPDPCFIFASTDNVNMIINNCTQGANNEYFWDFGDGVTSTETHPIHEYMEPGLYSVSMIVTDEFNCVDSLRQDYRINGPVYIANAFSPNGDGINDEIFVIGKSIQQEDFFWAIYDRHGSLVFLSVSPSIGWDGTILGGRDAQPGVYVYRLKYKDVNGSLFEKDGNITLIR